MVRYEDGTTSDLPSPKRYITTHDEQGKAIFYAEKPELEDVNMNFMHPAALHVHYSTTDFPVDFSGEKDISKFLNPIKSETLANKGGSVCRMVDLAPGEQSPMHRTVSLDYGVVLEGEIELILESWDGPKRVMRRGDVSVQRGTMHAWRNASKDKWVRMLYVLVDAEPIKFGGKALEEDLDGMVLPNQK